MTPFERWAVLGTSLLVTVTGAVYLWMKYVLTPTGPWAVINHPWQPLVLKVHILAAPALVFSVGLIAMRHVWMHLRGRRREGRGSGLLLVAAVGPMVLTGYGIQLVTHIGWLAALAWTHIGAGLAYGAGLLVHWLVVGRGHDPAAPRRSG